MAKSHPGGDVDSDHNPVLMDSELYLKRKQICMVMVRWNTVKIKNDSESQEYYR